MWSEVNDDTVRRRAVELLAEHVAGVHDVSVMNGLVWDARYEGHECLATFVQREMQLHQRFARKRRMDGAAWVLSISVQRACVEDGHPSKQV